MDFKSRIRSFNSRIAARFTLPALLVLTGALPVFAAGNSENLEASLISTNPKSKIQNPKSDLPSAVEILAKVRENFPQEVLFIKGQILSGGRIGKLQRACYIEMAIAFGEDPVTLSCKISDAFGTPVEHLTISMAEGCEAEFEYETGNPLQPAAAPPPTAAIRNTDVTWNDLGLLFLWRADGRMLREESLRGRDCYVIAFPHHENGTILIWIDTQMMMLIQMEEYDRDGKLRRRMTVKNIKKISDRWMVKNMEIRSYPSFHHTCLRIDDIVHGQ